MQTTKFKWPLGFQAGATHAGFKPGTALDLAWLVSNHPCAAAGVYTKNQFQAAPVQVTKHTINLNHELQAIIINSGNTNSFTGQAGIKTAEKEQQLVAKKLGIAPELVGGASTGIIGKQLDLATFEHGLAELTQSDSTAAPEAIITTDTHSKTVCISIMLDGQPVTITGFAKGSGMIHPNMGTTLGFIATDAAIDGAVLQDLLAKQINNSFNQITVDGCMSTNDMVIAVANGAANNQLITANHPNLPLFAAAFREALVALAKQVAADGEVSTKLIQATVLGATSQADANHAARAIIGSNLIKAMVFGEDANWGRIIQALGQTNIQLNPTAINIQFGEIEIVKNSTLQEYDRTQLKAIMAADEVDLTVNLQVGPYTGVAWGCDLTYKYVEINAAYEG